MSILIRETSETRVRLSLSLGEKEESIATGDGFLDHMLNTLSRYGGLGLGVSATGDLRHHLIEDVATTLGICLRPNIPESCARYGDATIPMDDALVQATVDLGGRAYYEGSLPSALYEHLFRSLAQNCGMTLHIRVIRGRDRHHVVEAAMKALGLAIRQALTAAEGGVFSTKGGVSLQWERRD